MITLHDTTSTSLLLCTTISEHIALKLGLSLQVQMGWDIEEKDRLWCVEFKKKILKLKKGSENK